MAYSKIEMVEAITEHLAEKGKRMSNLKRADVSQLEEIIKKYDIDIETFSIDRKNTMKQEKQQNNKTKTEDVLKKLLKFNVGEDVLYYTNYQTDYDRFYVKCRIMKINKKSITIQKYCSVKDIKRDNEILRNQTYGYVNHTWTDELLTKKCVVRDVEQLKKRGSYLDDYFVNGELSVDYGN